MASDGAGKRAAQKDGFVCLLDDDLRIEWNDWPWEAIGIFERFPDTVMVGGQIWDGSDIVLDAGQYFGFAGPCGSPNRGRLRTDPGYFGQMWKQRSVSAVSTQCAVVRANFLADSLPGLPLQASIPCLGAWLGARAFREGARVVYTPYIGGELKGNRSAFLTEPERESFLRINSDLIPDHRFYPAVLSLEHGYQLR